ncbi:MAG: 50S ribosomal protein L29 [Cellvibrionales bacterium]|nr:50S ribosomal protein L29 [Cellvibrionales bacterium]
MQASELRAKSATELQDQLLELRKEQLAMRLQQAAGQLGQTHQVREVRRDLARIKTVLAEKAAQSTKTAGTN